MTTPDYADLDELIGRLKRAAIDAYMHELGCTISSDWYECDGNSDRNDFPNPVVVRITRPGVTGAGGGAASAYPVWFIPASFPVPFDSFEDKFSQIRGEVDGLIGRWRDLPDPKAIQVVLDDWAKLRSVLAVSADWQSGQVSGSGAIATTLMLVQQNANSLTGATGERFKAGFLFRVGAVVGGLWAISLMAAAAVAAQQGMWERARSAVATAIDGATVSLDAVAMSTADKGHDVVLNVLSAAMSAAAVMVEAAAGVEFKLAAVGIDLLGKVAADQEKAPDTIGGSSFRSVMDSLGVTLNDLAAQITTTERAVADNITNNLKTVDGMGRVIRHPGSGSPNPQSDPFDLQVPAISSTAHLQIESYDHVAGIYQTDLPIIAEELDSATAKVVGIHTYDALRRDPSIGISPTGASDQHRDATWLMYKIGIDLVWDVREGAKNLEAAAEEFKYQDRKHANALKKIAAEIQAGSPTVDPWS